MDAQLSFLALCLVGCFPGARSATITSTDLSDPARTRLTNRVRQTSGYVEEPPAGLSREIVVDEATLTRKGIELCASITLRTEATHDVPLSEWDATVNGEPVRFGEELVDVRDYPFAGERTVVVAERVTAHAASAFRLTQPFEGTFRVFERRATACAPAKGSEFALSIKRIEAQQWFWEEFRWEIR